MAYENIYEGAAYGLESNSDNIYTGSTFSAGNIGGTTSVQTANQITEVSNLLNSGMKPIEVSMIKQDVFDMIPKQHLKEINRLAKLTGAEISLHAPLVEPTGFTEQGGWSEQNRLQAEKQFTDTVLRAHELSPDRNIPVTLHASNLLPGTDLVPTKYVSPEYLTDEEKKLPAVPMHEYAVERETGKIVPLKRDLKYDMESPEPTPFTPEKKLDSINKSEWTHGLTNLGFYTKELEESKDDPLRAELFERDIELNLRTFYEKARKYGDEEAQEKLKEIQKVWQEKAQSSEFKNMSQEKKSLLNAQLINQTIGTLLSLENAPKVYQPLNEFALEKASETFGNSAFEAFKKFGDKSPVVSIENPPYGVAMSDAESLKKLIEASRKQFEKKAIASGISESEAEKQAKKLIGATWDTSHIAMMKSHGFTNEDLLKQTKTIAPFVKHVHFNDNLGGSHTDLPPGMGDTNIGKISDVLKKANPEAKRIFEGGNFFQNFRTSPHPLVLEAMGSPLYSLQAKPAWNRIYNVPGVYSSGYGNMLPDQHFSLYGAGFSGLPTDLGGQIAGGQSRMSGTPMS